MNNQVINWDDYLTNFWEHYYKITVSSTSYIVNASCEGDAIDIWVDWVEENDPDYLVSVEEMQNMTNEECDEYITGGNHGRLIKNEEDFYFNFKEIPAPHAFDRLCDYLAAIHHFEMGEEQIKGAWYYAAHNYDGIRSFLYEAISFCPYKPNPNETFEDVMGEEGDQETIDMYAWLVEKKLGQ